MVSRIFTIRLVHCLFCFVLLTKYWGIIKVPGVPRVNGPQRTFEWGGRILTLRLNHVAGVNAEYSESKKEKEKSTRKGHNAKFVGNAMVNLDLPVKSLLCTRASILITKY